jgi:four helix bundle protein
MLMDERELKERTKQFALRCMKLADSLPYNKPSSRAVANQLVRCGTSVGANYRAACRSRSRAEFLSKLCIVEEEADESTFWMELIADSAIKPRRLVEPLRVEADELTRIMVASIRSARSSNPKSAIQNPK